MPYVQLGRNRVNYGLEGNPGGEVIVFLNGLTQTNSLWAHHRERLSKQGYRVLTYDMVGQGLSSKPVLGIRLEDHAKLLCQMLDALEIERCYLAGISYGGVVSLHTTIHYPERVKGLIAMSTFCEMPGQLEMLGRVFHMAITQAGFPLIQSMLLPMNFSSKWLEQIRTNLPEHLRRGYVINDPYAIQNLMESYVNFQPFAQDLAKIQCPTLILNGEFDFLTPRLCHETLRQNIENSRLMIIPHGFHAFTLEYPEVTVRVLEAFVRSVEEGTWRGDKSVWVASEDTQNEVFATRCVGDHMRAVFVSTIGDQQPEEWRSPLPQDADTPSPAKSIKAAAKPIKTAKAKPAVKPAKAAPTKAKPAGAGAVKPAKAVAAKAAKAVTPAKARATAKTGVPNTVKPKPAKPAAPKAGKVAGPKASAESIPAAASLPPAPAKASGAAKPNPPGKAQPAPAKAALAKTGKAVAPKVVKPTKAAPPSPAPAKAVKAAAATPSKAAKPAAAPSKIAKATKAKPAATKAKAPAAKTTSSEKR